VRRGFAIFLVATFVSMALVAYSQRPTIPFLEGLELAAAQQKVGGDFELVKSWEKSSQPKGTILSQSPKPGAEPQWDEMISVVVSAGRDFEKIQVPDVISKPRSEAEKFLTREEFKVEVKTNESSEEDADKVLEQSPPAGIQVKKGSEVAITIGEYSPPLVSPRSLEFGKQKVGTTGLPPGAVTLTNEGSTPLNIGNIVASSDFDQENDCGSVEPGASCTIRVTFTPTAQDDRNGTLTVSHNAPGSPEEVPLSGEGVSAASPEGQQRNETGQRVPTVVDQVAPTITITSPADDAVYTLNQPVKADYSCVDTGGSELASCTSTNGTVAVSNGVPIGTSTAGSNSFTVTATDNAGNTNSLTHNYTVGPASPGADQNRSAAGPSQYANY
jgi:hypothetical protein